MFQTKSEPVVSNFAPFVSELLQPDHCSGVGGVDGGEHCHGREGIQ